MLLRHELDIKWGDHCRSCAHCLCISKTVVTAKYEDTEEQFCSKECSLKYNMLLCNVSWCMCPYICTHHSTTMTDLTPPTALRLPGVTPAGRKGS